jgi:Xaa-Pro aminopeptidase
MSRPRPTDLDGFRSVQQLAYRCAQDIETMLRPGMTEREVAARMRWWLQAHGVDDWFHLPYAWFGDRTSFTGFRVAPQFLPSGRRLEEGMPYILDCAPVVDGYTADIGYAGCLGTSTAWERMMSDLCGYRALIVELVRARRPLREIYAEVDQLIAQQGYENRHRVYPGAVIAHRVWRLESRLPRLRLARFGIRSLSALQRELFEARRQGRSSPLWNGGSGSGRPASPGLWAVEPHLGLGGVGVKFEELLVVTEDDAFWLDDDLPHVRRWLQDGRSAAEAGARERGALGVPVAPSLREAATPIP